LGHYHLYCIRRHILELKADNVYKKKNAVLYGGRICGIWPLISLNESPVDGVGELLTYHVNCLWVLNVSNSEVIISHDMASMKLFEFLTMVKYHVFIFIFVHYITAQLP